MLAGGYEPLLSTLNLAPDETATGLIAFDTTESSGSLSLTTYEGAWAPWPISATVPTVGIGAFGTPVHPEAAEVPFSVVVANPRWVSTGDPAIRFDPGSGSYLIFDVSVTLVEGALDPTSSLSMGNDSWQFVPDGATEVSSDNGEHVDRLRHRAQLGHAEPDQRRWFGPGHLGSPCALTVVRRARSGERTEVRCRVSLGPQIPARNE